MLRAHGEIVVQTAISERFADVNWVAKGTGAQLSTRTDREEIGARVPVDSRI